MDPPPGREADKDSSLPIAITGQQKARPRVPCSAGGAAGSCGLGIVEIMAPKESASVDGVGAVDGEAAEAPQDADAVSQAQVGTSGSTEGMPVAVADGLQLGVSAARVRRLLACNAPVTSHVGPPLRCWLRADGEELLDALRKQVEYYFSRENLANDAFLVHQMNAQMYVPLSVIATFNNIRMLTDDVDVIRFALAASKEVLLDASGSMVRPNITAARNTIVLREVVADTTDEDIMSIFSGEECPTPNGVRPDINDTWFVSFNSEEEATDALMAIQDRRLNGAPIKARIKSESAMRSFYKPNVEQPAALAVGLPAEAQSAPSPSAYVGGLAQPQEFSAVANPGGVAYYGQAPLMQSPYGYGPQAPWAVAPGAPSPVYGPYGDGTFVGPEALYNPYADSAVMGSPAAQLPNGSGGRGGGRNGKGARGRGQTGTQSAVDGGGGSRMVAGGFGHAFHPHHMQQVRRRAPAKRADGEGWEGAGGERGLELTFSFPSRAAGEGGQRCRRRLPRRRYRPGGHARARSILKEGEEKGKGKRGCCPGRCAGGGGRQWPCKGQRQDEGRGRRGGGISFQQRAARRGGGHGRWYPGGPGPDRSRRRRGRTPSVTPGSWPLAQPVQLSATAQRVGPQGERRAGPRRLGPGRGQGERAQGQGGAWRGSARAHFHAHEQRPRGGGRGGVRALLGEHDQAG